MTYAALFTATPISHGGNTLEEMAAATKLRGYGYFRAADHSRSASYAGGSSVEQIQEQHRLADKLHRRYLLEVSPSL